MPLEKDAIYVMDKAYVDFAALYEMEQVGAFFATRARTKDNYSIRGLETKDLVIKDLWAKKS